MNLLEWGGWEILKTVGLTVVSAAVITLYYLAGRKSERDRLEAESGKRAIQKLDKLNEADRAIDAETEDLKKTVPNDWASLNARRLSKVDPAKLQ